MAFTQVLNRSAGSKRLIGRIRSCGKRAPARLCAGEEGQSVLEMAFMMPILMTLLMALFWVGWTYNNQIILTQAVGAGGAFLNSVAQGGLNGVSDPCGSATTEIDDWAATLNTSHLTITYYVNGTAVPLTSGGCPSYLSEFQARGNTVTVQATYPCSMSALNGIGNLISGTSFSSGCLMTAKVSESVY